MENKLAIIKYSKTNLSSYERNQNSPKICVICGGPTKCFHYGIPSCNGCKTFFRRCILSEKKYVCQLSGNCEVTITSKCKACRFKKCLDKGMNYKAIQTSKVKPRKDIIESEQKLDENNCKDICLSNRDVVSHYSLVSQTLLEKNLKDLCYIEFKHKYLRESVFHGKDFKKYNIDELFLKSSIFGNIEQYEKSNFRPIIVQFEKSIFEVTRDEFKIRKKSFKPHHKRWIVTDALLIIDYAKTLSFFKNLPLNEQIQIMQNVGSSLLIAIKAFYSYKMNQKYIYYPDGMAPIAMHKNNIPIEIEIFVNTVKPWYRLKITDEEFSLIKVLLICSGSTKNLCEQSKSLLEKQKEFYAYLLLEYLQIQYGHMKGVTRFADILCFIKTLFIFGEKYKEFNLLLHLKIQNLHGNKQHRRSPPKVVELFMGK